MKEFKLIGVIALIVALAAIFSISNVSADEDSEDLNVSVQIASQTWIDIAPDHIRWYNVNPGTDSTNFTDMERSTTDHEGIVVRNIGSTDIYTVWFNASYPDDLPYGTGDINEYDTANFVLLSKADLIGNSSADVLSTDYYYINKVEYAEAERQLIGSAVHVTNGRNIPYLKTDDPTSTSNVTIGRLRDGENEYFWAIVEDADGDCDQTAAEAKPKFYIGLAPHNETHVGDIDLRSGCQGTTCEVNASTMEDSGSNYYTFLSLDQNRWRGAVVKLATDCQSISVITWNRDMAGDKIQNPADKSANYWLANSSGYSGTLFPQGIDLGDDSRSADILAPGEYYTGWIKLRLPWGIPYGTLDEGTITVIASTATPA